MAASDFVTVSIVSTNEVAKFIPSGPMSLSISGTWSGTIVVQYSSDNGTTWRLVTTYTANPTTGTDYIPTVRGSGKIWRVIATAWSSGTAVVELGHV